MKRSIGTSSGTSRDPASGEAAPTRWRRPVTVLALGSFAMGTDSFILAGILPQISQGLNITAGAAGQTITAFALAYGLAAPFLAAFTSRLPRKPLMVCALVLFVLANLASAAAPDLSLLLTARILAGLGAALYTPSASAAAAALAGPAHRGRAMSIILGGLTLGTVFGVPIGITIGQHISWRAGLAFVAAVGATALLGMLAVLPALPVPPAIPLARRFTVLADRRVVAVVVFILLISASNMIFYTYAADILGQIAHITGGTLTMALLAWGVGGVIGSFGSGHLTDRWGPERTLSVVLCVLIVGLAVLTLATSLPAVISVMTLYGAAAWSFATPNNHRLTALTPTLPGVVISFNSSGIYLGQAFGAGLGGILLSHGLGARTLCFFSAGVALTAAVVHLFIGRPVTS
ncbi:MFS transporter [Streptomyces muensis]|uniref:MFS transporter n=1 Tax=Streptomyces muensis TaxID=1077944 RepID=A0A9X1Q468_STRM4|nr:MFS transporter [Streptomyces muensis]MCF1596961.1 MFS transporter [Streptomyces muensis]